MAQSHFTNTKIITAIKPKATLSNFSSFLPEKNSASNHNSYLNTSSSPPLNITSEKAKSRWSLFFWNTVDTFQPQLLSHNNSTLETMSEISTNASDSLSLPSSSDELQLSSPPQDIPRTKTQVASTNDTISSPLPFLSSQIEQSLLLSSSSSHATRKHLNFLSHLSHLSGSLIDVTKNDKSTVNIVFEQTPGIHCSSSISTVSMTTVEKSDRKKKSRIKNIIVLVILLATSFIFLLEKEWHKIQNSHNERFYRLRITNIFLRSKSTSLRNWWRKQIIYQRHRYIISITPLQEWQYLWRKTFVSFPYDDMQRDHHFISMKNISNYSNQFDRILLMDRRRRILFQWINCTFAMLDEAQPYPLNDKHSVNEKEIVNLNVDDDNQPGDLSAFWDVIGKVCIKHNYPLELLRDTKNNNMNTSEHNSILHFWKSRKKPFIKTSKILSLDLHELHSKKEKCPSSLVELDNQILRLSDATIKRSLNRHFNLNPNVANGSNVNNKKGRSFLFEQTDDNGLMYEKPLAETVGEFFLKIRDVKLKQRQQSKKISEGQNRFSLFRKKH